MKPLNVNIELENMQTITDPEERRYAARKAAVSVAIEKGMRPKKAKFVRWMRTSRPDKDLVCAKIRLFF